MAPSAKAGIGYPLRKPVELLERIIARSKGGTDHTGNLQLPCGSCNRIKGDRGMEYTRVKLQF